MKYSLTALVALLLLSVSITSCDSAGGSNDMTSNGFKYTIHKGGSDEMASSGEFQIFQIDLRDEKDRMIQSTAGYPEPPSMKLDTTGKTDAGIPPIGEVLAQMSVGDSAVILFPVDSMKQTDPRLDTIETLKYVIILRDVMSDEDMTAKRMQAQAELQAVMEANQARLPEVEKLSADMHSQHKAGTVKWQEGPDGLKYIIHEEGTGPTAKPGDRISAQYYGYMPTDGSMFDTSFRGGNPFSFTIGNREVIQGWDIAFQQFNEGTKATIFLPSEIAYGERGSGRIPGGSDLMFYVELEDIL